MIENHIRKISTFSNTPC